MDKDAQRKIRDLFAAHADMQKHKQDKDLQEILQAVNDRLKEKKNFSAVVSKEYNDEPIVKTGKKLTGALPQEIFDLIELMNKPDFRSMSSARAFYVAARFMENFEDSYEKEAYFFKYYPTFRDMTSPQLRTYFTWRADVRRKNVRDISLSYAYLYIYELINQIGVSSPEEGFFALKYFMLEFSKYDSSVTAYYVKWLTEYAVYYELPAVYLENIRFSKEENAAGVLEDYANASDEELYAAMKVLSPYDPDSSAFVKEYSEDFSHVAAEVFRRRSDFCAKHRKNTLMEKCFGIKDTYHCYFFGNAVFYETKKHRDCEYVLSKSRIYTCKDGSWSVTMYLNGVKRSKELGALIRETDRIMRLKYGYKRPLIQKKVNKSLEALIAGVIDEFLLEKERKKKAEITIDISSLAEIRSDAEITKNMLMTEEDAALPEEIVPVPSEPPAAVIEAETKDTLSENADVLDSTEKEFLSVLLAEGDIKSFAAENGVKCSIVSESINEKLFDIFGDTVIEFENDIPHIIEDYKEELSAL